MTCTTPEQYEAAKAEWQIKMSEYVARRDAAMAEAGVRTGDVLYYDAVSPWHEVTAYQGTLYIAKTGRPMIRLQGSRSSKPWHKGWRKAS